MVLNIIVFSYSTINHGDLACASSKNNILLLFFSGYREHLLYFVFLKLKWAKTKEICLPIEFCVSVVRMCVCVSIHLCAICVIYVILLESPVNTTCTCTKIPGLHPVMPVVFSHYLLWRQTQINLCFF